jgi:hypothetical protein
MWSRHKHKGVISIRELPRDMSLEDYLEMWPRLTEKEKDRYTVYRSENQLLTAGRNITLDFWSSQVAQNPFAQYFAVGNDAGFTGVLPADTTLAGEVFRKVPTTITRIGGQVDVATLFLTSEGNFTYTNAGLFGNNATATPGSGSLYTHAPYSYTKTSAVSITNDYVMTLS